MKIIFLSFMTLFLMVPHSSYAQDEAVSDHTTGLPIPRFVSLDSQKVYVRSGPALRYPIKWVYKRKNLPVEIVQEFDSWRKIKDFEGEEGWIHSSLLSGRRSVLIQNDGLVPMYEGFSPDSRVMAKFEPNVVAQIDECVEGWCRLEKDAYKGWVERKFLWGIYEDEELD